MNEHTINAVPVGSCPPLAPLPGWESFEQALASALSVLKDEFLIVSTRAGNRFVQFHARPDARVFAETVCNAYLGPSEKLDAGQMADLLSMGWMAPTHAPGSLSPVSPPKGSPNHFREFPHPCSCAEIARFAVRTLAEVLRIASPAELQYRAFDDEGRSVTLPALQIHQEPAPSRKVKSPPEAKGSGDFGRLRARVLAAARNGSGLGSLIYDEGGSIEVPIGNRTGWVRPFEKPYFVRVHVQLLGDVDGDEELLGRIHEVNARLPIARVICTDGSVFLGVDFPAVPFRPEHLAQAVTTLAQLADGVLRDLRPGEEPARVAS